MAADLQFALDFERKLPPSAQIGMQVADDNADHRWKRWVDSAIMAVARRLAYFTVDDVLTELEALPNPPDTHNLAALGPRMKEVAKTLGYMTGTPELRRSRRREKNGNLHRVWRSNLIAKETTDGLGSGNDEHREHLPGGSTGTLPARSPESAGKH